MCVSPCECEKALHISLCKSLLIYSCAFSPLSLFTCTCMRLCERIHRAPFETLHVFLCEPNGYLSIWAHVSALSLNLCASLCVFILVSVVMRFVNLINLFKGPILCFSESTYFLFKFGFYFINFRCDFDYFFPPAFWGYCFLRSSGAPLSYCFFLT